MAEINAEIEVVVRVPGTIIYDRKSFEEWLDGRPETNEELFDYIREDPDWAEGSSFPWASPIDGHEVIESEIVSVNDNREPESQDRPAGVEE